MKTLVIQTAFLGDLLLTLPLIRALKLKDSEVHLLCRAGLSELLQNNQDVDSVMELDKKGTGDGLSFLPAVRKIGSMSFDKAVIPHRSVRSSLIAFLAGIPQRIGFFSAPGYVFYTESIEYPPTGHQILRMLLLAHQTGIEADRFPVLVYPSKENFQKADNLISNILAGKSRNIVSIAPGSVWATKRWPASYYSHVARYFLSDRHFLLILAGSKDDSALCLEISKTLPPADWAISAGDFSIMDTAALFARSSFVVANDSAAGHLASAVKTPVLTIFGPTVPAFGFYPVGKNNIIAEKRNLYCRPCSSHGPMKCPESHFRCMKELTPEEVIERMKIILDRI